MDRGPRGGTLAATPVRHRSGDDPVRLCSAGAPEQCSFFRFVVLVLPILACFSIVRDVSRTAGFAAIYAGVILFAWLWSFAGAPRHQGYLFVALVGSVWMARSAYCPLRRWPRYGLCSSSSM